MKDYDGYLKGIIAIVVASFLWGTTGTVASYSIGVSALAIGAFSSGIGGVLLVITAHKKLAIDYRLIMKQPKLLFLGAASVAIYPLAFYSAMYVSGIAIGTVVSIASAPLFAALLERLINKKQITQQWIGSFLIGTIGIVLLVLGKEHENTIASNFQQQGIGVLLGCLAGLTYASYSWAAKRLIESGVQSQSSMSVLFGCAAVFLIPSLWFTGDNLFASPLNSLVSFYMAIVPMFIGYLLFGFGLNVVDASKATLITLFEPLIATMLAIFILGETFNAMGWIGGALISICLLMQTLKPAR
jgi:drug/metabolite transporter, DME family